MLKKKMFLDLALKKKTENVSWSFVSDSATPWTVASVHRILQAGILEWIAIPFFRESS